MIKTLLDKAEFNIKLACGVGQKIYDNSLYNTIQNRFRREMRLDIIVCVKHVPETAEAELKINATGKDIEKAGLVYDINEWDDYALEEAVRIKEKFGGTVTAITVGPEDSESTLRKCLARGADKAIRLTDPKFAGSDAYATAKILYSVIKNLHFDLILTGAQAGDDGSAVVGPVLAELLGIPHATMVKKIEFSNGKAIVNRELEGGLEERLEVKLPALFAVQTGINEPRYVSIMGIRKAMQKEVKVMGLADIGLSENDVGETGSWLKIERLYVPPVEKQAEFLKGSPDEIATRIVEILKSRGLI
ncbi:MAG: electron transfer flavoprotein subunit beta/FixA family protein [Candidatus Bathyarchaeia archaeon]